MNVKKSKLLKTESIEEFFKRGGTITQAEPNKKDTPNMIRSTTKEGAAVFLSLEDADLFYGEESGNKKIKKEKEKIDKINFWLLPRPAQLSYLSKLKEAIDGEGSLYEKEVQQLEKALNERIEREKRST